MRVTRGLGVSCFSDIVIVTPRDVAKFLGALEASKKEPYFRFWLVSCSNFKNLYLAKVLFLLQLPKLYFFCGEYIINFLKEYLHLLYFFHKFTRYFLVILQQINNLIQLQIPIHWLHCAICRLTKMQFLNSMPQQTIVYGGMVTRNTKYFPDFLLWENRIAYFLKYFSLGN